jgi:hypothetical protein
MQKPPQRLKMAQVKTAPSTIYLIRLENAEASELRPSTIFVMCYASSFHLARDCKIAVKCNECESDCQKTAMDLNGLPPCI